MKRGQVAVRWMVKWKAQHKHRLTLTGNTPSVCGYHISLWWCCTSRNWKHCSMHSPMVAAALGSAALLCVQYVHNAFCFSVRLSSALSLRLKCYLWSLMVVCQLNCIFLSLSCCSIPFFSSNCLHPSPTSHLCPLHWWPPLGIWTEYTVSTFNVFQCVFVVQYAPILH